MKCGARLGASRKRSNASSRRVRALYPRPFPTQAGIQTILDEIAREAKGKTLKLDDFVDMRALRELEKGGFFK